MNSTYSVALIRGDGIGRDVMDATLSVIEAARRRVTGFEIRYDEMMAGAAYFEETGQDIEPGAEEAAGRADAILLGAIGLPSVRHRDGTEISPHLRLRERVSALCRRSAGAGLSERTPTSGRSAGRGDRSRRST